MQTVIPRPQRTLLSPREISGYFAEYDISDFSSLTVDAANRISQWNDKSGNAYNLAQATVANRPIYLPWSGTNYGYLNGAPGNYFSTPDSAALDITGDIDLRAQVALVDWTPSAISRILGKWDSTTNNRSYGLNVQTSGVLQFVRSADGTATILANSTVAPTVADGSSLWVRATFESSTGNVKFYTSTDGSTWTQLGATVSTAAGGIFSGTGQLQVGAFDAGNQMSGNVLRAQVLNGIDGTVVADFNPSLYTSGTTFTASTGEVWTLNGGSTIVTQPMAYGDGSDDSLRASFTLAQPYTVIAVMNPRAWTSGRYLWGGNNGANSGALTQTTSTPRVSLNSGSAAAENTNLALQRRAIVQAVFNGASSSLQINGTTATTGNPGTTAPNGLTLFANGAATAASFGAANFNHVLIYSGALDAGSILRLRLWLANKWGVSL